MNFWDKHGTKILGYLAAFVAGVQGAAAVMTPPPFPPLVSVLLAGVNVTLGVATVKRGYTNAKTPDTHDDGTAGESQ